MELKEAIKDYLKAHLSRKRWKHSKRTAKCAKRLAKHYGVSKKRAYLAGLGHDIARELKDDVILKLAKSDGLPIREFEKKHPKLLHGRAGAVLLKRELGVNDPAVLDAVRWHTLGRSGLGDVGKILYLADYLEPGRKGVAPEFREEILNFDLDKALIRIIHQSRQLFPDSPQEIMEEVQEWVAELENNDG